MSTGVGAAAGTTGTDVPVKSGIAPQRTGCVTGAGGGGSGFSGTSVAGVSSSSLTGCSSSVVQVWPVAGPPDSLLVAASPTGPAAVTWCTSRVGGARNGGISNPRRLSVTGLPSGRPLGVKGRRACLR